MPTDPAAAKQRRTSKFGFLLRPKWIAFHVLVLVLVVVMVNLAFWQLRRLDQRQRFNAQVDAHTHQPITPFDDLRSTLADPAAVEWRPVRVSGTYLPDHQFLVVNRSQHGDTGRNIVDALTLDDGSLLLVNRGFLPNSDGLPAVPSGRVTVVGRLRSSEVRTTGQPADQNVADLSEIHRIDIPLLAGQFDTNVQPMYIAQVESTPPDASMLQPIVLPDTSDEGPHLSYTVQWFIFSACALAGWVLAVRRSIATRSGKPRKRRKSAYVPIADDQSVV
jgi:cytochrome oxidase assembly protein ShyY1